MGPVGQSVSLGTDMEVITDTLMDLLGSKDVQDELKETARIYFTSPDVTINLIWAVLILGLLGLVLKPLFGIPLLENILGAMTSHGGSGASYGGGVSSDYGAPSGGYGAPSAGYGTPSAGYDSPSSGYDSPSSGYDSPSTGSGFNPGTGYSAPQSGYSKRSADFLSEEQKDFANGLIYAYPSESALEGSLLSNLLPLQQTADNIAPLLN